MERVERECPWCAELVLVKAKVCKHCGHDLTPMQRASKSSSMVPSDALRPQKDVSDSGAPDHSLSGIDGWLVWFILGQAITALIYALGVWRNVQIAGYLHLVAHIPNSFTTPGRMHATDAYALVGGLLSLAALVAAALVWTRHPLAPTYVQRLLGAEVLLVLLMGYLYGIAYAAIQSEHLLSSKPIPGLGGNLLSLGIWIAYWDRSKRVRATFGYRGVHVPSSWQPPPWPGVERRRLVVAGVSWLAVLAIIAIAAKLSPGLH